MTSSFELTRTPKFDEAFADLPEETKERVLKKFKEFEKQINEYSVDPRQHGSTKYIAKKRVWRLRIGDYRAFFDILGDEIKFLSILHRKDAYKR